MARRLAHRGRWVATACSARAKAALLLTARLDDEEGEAGRWRGGRGRLDEEEVVEGVGVELVGVLLSTVATAWCSSGEAARRGGFSWILFMPSASSRWRCASSRHSLLFFSFLPSLFSSSFLPAELVAAVASGKGEIPWDWCEARAGGRGEFYSSGS